MNSEITHNVKFWQTQKKAPLELGGILPLASPFPPCARWGPPSQGPTRRGKDHWY